MRLTKTYTIRYKLKELWGRTQIHQFMEHLKISMLVGRVNFDINRLKSTTCYFLKTPQNKNFERKNLKIKNFGIDQLI